MQMGFAIGLEENDEFGWDRIIESGGGGEGVVL
jgi:hypothetical protein